MSSNVKTEEEIFKENELTPQTVSKYQMAAEIVQKSLKELLPLIVADATVGDICQKGDELVKNHSSKVSKNTQNGVFFNRNCVSNLHQCW